MTFDSIPEKLAGGRLTIDLAALADNWRKLNAMTPNAECAAVVKANAYGIGIEKAVPALWKAGCRTFFVALPEEGIRVRKASPEAIIYILAGYLPDTARTYAYYALRPVLCSHAEIDAWLAINKRRRKKLPYGLQVETGMRRVGLHPGDVPNLLSQEIIPEDFKPALYMSHLASADNPASPQNARQLQEFKRACEFMPETAYSLANSAAIFLGKEYHHDLVRPGIALYGGASAQSHLSDNPMKPVVRAEARILSFNFARPGDTIGYGGAETVTPSNIPSEHDRRTTAIVAVGYADGYLRAAGSSDIKRGAEVAWFGHRVPIIGRISMDLISIDITHHPWTRGQMKLPKGAAQAEWVELIGPTIPLDEVAGHGGTIGYELLTALGQRYHRRYVEA